MKKPLITQEQMKEFLDKCYDASITGIPGLSSCHELASDYLIKYNTPEVAAKKLIKAQITKATTSGFITNIGGLITLPVAIPANLASVMYIQMRMIISIAIIAGYDPHDDEVQTLVYVCLAGVSITDICKKTGVKFANIMAENLIRRIPKEVITRINQAVRRRLITKFGSTGLINLGKIVPVVGGVVGGGFDLVETKIIANRTYKTFIEKIIE